MPDELPEWMHPPRSEGWFADDLDHMHEAPKHTELIDGSLVFRLTPHTSWHSRAVGHIQQAVSANAPAGVDVYRGMTVTLDRHNRLEADVLAITAPYEPECSWFAPEDVALVAEVESAESAHRDRTVKHRKYAEAGIPHYWRITQENVAPVVHAYELDGPTGTYVAAGIFRGSLERSVPFPITLELEPITR